MYNLTHAYSDLGRPYYETDLIVADGEAEAIFLEDVVNKGYVEQCFMAIDDISQDTIDLEITMFIKEKAYNSFEKLINNYTEEDGDLTYTKANSWFIACGKAKR